MTNYRKTLVAASVAVATVALTSMVLTPAAYAQCLQCAMYPDRDPLNGGVQTPAGKMGMEFPNGAAASHAASVPASVNNARAEMRVHHVRHVRSSDARNR
jgi:hypothetical protein